MKSSPKSKRAIRRKHIHRLIKKRKDYWSGGARTPRALANTPTPCSCQMCCNVRKSSWAKGKERLTLQERRQENIKDLVSAALEEINQ